MSRIVATYPYTDEAGAVLFEAVRYSSPKTFSQRVPLGNGKYEWKLNGVRRVPYHLADVLERKASETVLICEGEKDADALRALGFCATTNALGVNWPWTSEFVEFFRGSKRIAVITDCDVDGRKGAAEHAKLLAAIVDDVRLIDIAPERNDKYDVSDWINADHTADELMMLVSEATPILLVKEAAAETSHWPMLGNFVSAAHRVPTLKPDILPQAFRPYVVDAAERMNIAPEMVAVPLIIAASSLLGDVRIRPKQYDDWTVCPNLWGAVVARPARMKTPSINEALRPIQTLEQDLKRQFASEHINDDVLRELAKAAIATCEKNLKSKDAALDEGAADLANQRAVLAKIENARPRRYIVHDATHEKLGEILSVNERGVLYVRDELTGWLEAIDNGDRAGARPFFLEAWNGGQRFVFDRISRGTTEVPRNTVSVVGGIQPAKFERYVKAMRDGSGDDGLLQRLQLLIYPDQQPEWCNVDRAPDAAAYDTVASVFEALDDETKRSAFGARLNDTVGAYVIRFEHDAQAAFDIWRDKLEVRLRGAGMTFSPALESHLAKYRSLVPSLALIFHAVDTVMADADAVPEGISLGATLRAIALADFLELHARKVYSYEGPEAVVAALVEHIEAGDVFDGMTVRDCGRKGWSGLGSEALAFALERLTEIHWLRVESVKPPIGRSKSIIRLNPDLRSSK